jgi:hypothetical protein
MTAQKTHVPDRDPETGETYLRQIASPRELRRILRASGDSVDRPKDFRPRDGWAVV